jgi:predicted acyl esterase
VNLGGQQIDDPDTFFWQERDLLRLTKKSKVPLFLTQGFLETNTKPDGAFDFFNGLAGKHNRAWFGQFDHVRGWEMEGDRLATGRRGFVKEVMRFFDHYVKRVPLKRAPVHKDPNIVVQDARGRYRAEAQWPPADARLFWSGLKPGSYTDEGLGSSTSSDGVWSISQPLRHAAWITGEPVLKVALQAVPRANLVGNVYDVSPRGRATLITRGTWLVRGAADQKIKFDLYGQDWPIAKGHRIAVRLSSSNNDWWTHIPTFTPVTIQSARIGLPFLKFKRTRFLSGGPTPRLRGHLQSQVVELSKQRMRAASKRFSLPPRLRAR